VRKPLAALLALVLVTGCDPDYVVHHVGWFSTMRHQRNIKPYAMPRSPAPGTIPVTGHEVDSLTLAAAERLVNPRTRTSESLNRGKVEFETYCLVCHGEKGLGDGPVSALHTPPGPFFGVRNLTDDVARKRSDGYLYGIVTNAVAMRPGIMPRYGDKIHGTDRWDVVNYVRSLQDAARAGGPR